MDESPQLLPKQLIRTPHRVGGSGLRLRKPAIAKPDKALLADSSTRLVGTRASGFRKCLSIFMIFTRPNCSFGLENGLLSTRESQRAPWRATTRRATAHSPVPWAPDLRSLDREIHIRNKHATAGDSGSDLIHTVKHLPTLAKLAHLKEAPKRDTVFDKTSIASVASDVGACDVSSSQRLLLNAIVLWKLGST